MHLALRVLMSRSWVPGLSRARRRRRARTRSGVGAPQAITGRFGRADSFQDPGVNHSTQDTVQSLDVSTDPLAHQPPFRDAFKRVHRTGMLGEIRADGLGHLSFALVIARHCVRGECKARAWPGFAY